MPPDSETAQFVMDARERLGMTQAELGKIVGRERRSIIRYEQGEDLPASLQLAILFLLSEHKETNGQRDAVLREHSLHEPAHRLVRAPARRRAPP
jgi:DNA-binding XRE family transcriptional regulator